MTIQLRKLTPNVMVEDVNKTIQFYIDVLGFELLSTVPEQGQFAWASLRNGGVELMFQSKASLAEEIPAFRDREVSSSLTFYIDAKDVHSMYTSLKDKVSIIQAIQKTFYGRWEFTMLDCNGYALTFSEEA